MLTPIEFHRHNPAPHMVQGMVPEDLEAIFLDAQDQLLALSKPHYSLPRAFSLVSISLLVATFFGR